MKILHIHIPKNAGSFVGANLAANYEPSQCFIVDEAEVTLEHFLADADRITSRYAFVGGHIPFRLVEPFADRFDLIVSAYRDPWERALSSFRYAVDVGSFDEGIPLDHDDAIVKFKSYIQRYYCENVATRNIQCGYLGYANLPAAALHYIDKYKIQMLSNEHVVEDLQALFARIDFTFDGALHPNRSSTGDFDLARGETPELDAKIVGWFDGDFELFEHLNRLRLPSATTAPKSMPAFDSVIGALVKARRTDVGLQPEHLAGLIGTSLRQLERYEDGSNRISVGRLVEIAAALQVHPSFFFESISSPP